MGGAGVPKPRMDAVAKFLTTGAQPAAQAFVTLNTIKPVEWPPLIYKFTLFKHLVQYVKDENARSMAERGKPRWRWIVRVDDDVIVCHRRLRALLHKLNPEADIYTGRLTSYDPKREKAIKDIDMTVGTIVYAGGFADIFSVSMAEKVVPHLEKCIHWSRKTHIPFSDVVMGACVNQFAGGEFLNAASIQPEGLTDHQFEQLKAERDLFINIDDRKHIIGNSDPFRVVPGLKFAAIIHRAYPDGLLQKTSQILKDLDTC
jgi:Fringe-like